MQPIKIRVTKGNFAESIHYAIACVSDSSGRIIQQWGNINKKIFPRSAIKPLQVISLIESGAYEYLKLAPVHLAIAAASHNGEPQHTKIVKKWMDKLGLSVKDLQCGIHPPLRKENADEILKKQRKLTPIYNNCSGKHLGMLSTTLYLEKSKKTYLAVNHPVQKMVIKIIEEMSNTKIKNVPKGIDGCGLPQYAIPLRCLSQAMAKFADPKNLSVKRQEAISKIKESIQANPYLIAGKERFDTDCLLATNGQIISKVGAEGVLMTAVLNRDIGIAIKILDGNNRAVPAALHKIFEHLKILRKHEKKQLKKWFIKPIYNHAKKYTGKIESA